MQCRSTSTTASVAAANIPQFSRIGVYEKSREKWKQRVFLAHTYIPGKCTVLLYTKCAGRRIKRKNRKRQNVARTHKPRRCRRRAFYKFDSMRLWVRARSPHTKAQRGRERERENESVYSGGGARQPCLRVYKLGSALRIFLLGQNWFFQPPPDQRPRAPRPLFPFSIPLPRALPPPPRVLGIRLSLFHSSPSLTQPQRSFRVCVLRGLFTSIFHRFFRCCTYTRVLPPINISSCVAHTRFHISRAYIYAVSFSLSHFSACSGAFRVVHCFCARYYAVTGISSASFYDFLM